MVEHKLNNLSQNYARLDERTIIIQERNEEISKKIDALFGQLLKAEADRQADRISYEQTIKLHISKKVDELKEYHDKDLEKIKKSISYLGVFEWFGKNKKVLIVLGLIILISFWQQINAVITNYTKEQGVEYPNEFDPNNMIFRGGTLENPLFVLDSNKIDTLNLY